MTDLTTAPVTLRCARKSRGMTIKELAAASGVSFGAISNIEWGARRFDTNYEIAYKLADALGLQIVQIAWPHGLSQRGTPGQVKDKGVRRLVDEDLRKDLCPSCFVKLPVTGICDSCN
jgi:transcriptional regulator with XRE-family HTH domain